MAEFIHGTKPELGPTHDATGALMCKQDCEACANRIFTLHTSFFVKEFKQKAAQQHGEASVCHDAKCAACNQEPSDVKCCGKDCSRDTGKIRTGVLACEIYQVHSRNAKCASVPGPVKRCGCLIHAKCWLLCSQECLLSSKYAKSVPEEDRPTFAALFAEKKFSIPEMGPLLSHDQYDGPDLSAAELALVCCTCGKRDAGKVCR